MLALSSVASEDGIGEGEATGGAIGRVFCWVIALGGVPSEDTIGEGGGSGTASRLCMYNRMNKRCIASNDCRMK